MTREREKTSEIGDEEREQRLRNGKKNTLHYCYWKNFV